MKHRPIPTRCASQQQGFTLAELLVVVVIVGLTTAWSLPNIQRNLAQPKWIGIGAMWKQASSI